MSVTRNSAPGERPLSWGVRMLAVVGAFVLVLCAGEALVRLAVPESRLLPIGDIHVHANDRMLWTNPFLLWEPRRGTYHDGGAMVYINALGFRGPESMTVEKPAGVYRVMVTGDSSVYGFGVTEEGIFTSRLQQLLAARHPGRQFEVINGAVPGWSTFQSLNMLESRGWQLQPDLLIIGNLFSDNNYDTFVDKELLAELAWQHRMSTLATSLDRSRLFRGARTLYAWFRPPEVQAPRQVRMADRSDRFTGRRRVAIDDYAKNLRRMIDEARARDCRVAFLILANRSDLEPSPPIAPWHPYRDVMRDIASKAGAPLADFAATAHAHAAEGGDALFLDRMHPTSRGHQLMAETMIDALGSDPAMARALAGEEVTSASGGRAE